MPPQIKLAHAKGFRLCMLPPMLNGQGSEIDDLAKMTIQR
jgi:hypothetical protein